MTGIIGSKYLHTLSQIKHNVQGIRNSAMQENPETYITKIPHGTCYYDRCVHPTRRKARISVITVHYDKQKKEINRNLTNFHKECLEALLKDERLTALN